MNTTLLFLIPLLPLCCGAANALCGMRLPRRFAVVLAVGGVAASVEGSGDRSIDVRTW